MSMWGDIHRRNAGVATRKEDNIECCVTLIPSGSGTKLPKRFSVPADIRVQRMILVFTTDEFDFTARTFYPKKLITYLPLAWTYKVGKKNVEEIDKMIMDLGDEFKYIVDEDGHNKLNDESKKMVEELKKRLKEYNEGVCGIPLWTIDPYEPFPQ